MSVSSHRFQTCWQSLSSTQTNKQKLFCIQKFVYHNEVDFCFSVVENVPAWGVRGLRIHMVFSGSPSWGRRPELRLQVPWESSRGATGFPWVSTATPALSSDRNCLALSLPPPRFPSSVPETSGNVRLLVEVSRSRAWTPHHGFPDFCSLSSRAQALWERMSFPLGSGLRRASCTCWAVMRPCSRADCPWGGEAALFFLVLWSGERTATKAHTGWSPTPPHPRPGRFSKRVAPVDRGAVTTLFASTASFNRRVWALLNSY